MSHEKTSRKKSSGRPSKNEKNSIVAAVGLAEKSSSKTANESHKVSTALGEAQIISHANDIRIFELVRNASPTDTDTLPFSPLQSLTSILDFTAILELSMSEEIQKVKYWGLLDGNFKSRMGFGSFDFKTFISKNPGYDLYFCNPNPQLEALYENLWVHGEFHHPDFIKLSYAFMEAAGLDKLSLGRLMPSNIIASGNYFVGNAKFWNEYLGYVTQAIKNAQENLSQELFQTLTSSKADFRGLHGGANYFHFITERLLSEFIFSQSNSLKCIKIRSPRVESVLGSHLKNLRVIRDLAARDVRQETLEVWRGYRELYIKAEKLRATDQAVQDKNATFK